MFANQPTWTLKSGTGRDQKVVRGDKSLTRVADREEVDFCDGLSNWAWLEFCAGTEAND